MDLAAKLQLKPGQSIEGVQVPDSVAGELSTHSLDGRADETAALVIFAVDRSTLDQHLSRIVEVASQDRLTWVSYPKSG